MNKRTKSKIPLIIISICLASALLISGAYAFLTAEDSKINKFTQGILSLSLTDNDWSEIDARKMMPKQIISKTARVFNNDENNISAWVFMSVKVPSTNVEFEDEIAPVSYGADGIVLAEKDVGEYYDLFNIKFNDNLGINSNCWNLVAYDASERNKPCGYTIYYYAYTTEPLLGVNPSCDDFSRGASATLFDSVQLVNIGVRPEDGTIINSIDVTGAGIQNDGISNIYTAWAAFANQNNDTSNVENLTFVCHGYKLNDNVISFYN